MLKVSGVSAAKSRALIGSSLMAIFRVGVGVTDCSFLLHSTSLHSHRSSTNSTVHKFWIRGNMDQSL